MIPRELGTEAELTTACPFLKPLQHLVELLHDLVVIAIEGLTVDMGLDLVHPGLLSVGYIPLVSKGYDTLVARATCDG